MSSRDCDVPGFVTVGWERFDSSSHDSFPNWLGQKVGDAKSNPACGAADSIEPGVTRQRNPRIKVTNNN
jgi:hypothetical protein